MATLKDLIGQVEKLDASLTRLQGKAAAIGAEMSSGNWGTGQIKEFSAQLDKVNASISRLQGKKLKLLDTASTRDFEILLRQINTITERINVGKGMVGLFKTDDPQYQKLMTQIANAERALSSLQSRKFTQFDAQGYRKQPGGTFGPIDLEARLNPVSKPTAQFPVTNYGDVGPKEDPFAAKRVPYRVLKAAIPVDSESKSVTDMKKELEGLQRTYDRLSNAAAKSKTTDSFSKWVVEIKKVSAQMDVLIDKIIIANTVSAGGPIGFITDYGKVGPKQDTAGLIKTKARGLYDEREALRGNLTTLGKSETSTALPGITKSDVVSRINAVTAALERLSAVYKTITDPGYIPTPGGRRVPPENKGTETPPTPLTSKQRADKKRQEAQDKKDADEADRQAYIRSDANKREMAFARLHGFDPETDYKGSTGFSGGGYRTSSWARKDAERGGMYKENIRVDSRGYASEGFIPKANQSFGQGISKDIGDLVKWSIAIGAIYGPLNAMSAAMSELIVNETKLAAVSVLLKDGLAGTDKVFSSVFSAAQKSGESISGVIDAFGSAYTAAGRITDQVDRYNTSLVLLDDSLALSKISTLDQASAIDILTAALYQTAKAPVIGEGGKKATSSETAVASLSRGKDLIDEWVLVSRNASVSVETLATGVAVLGDSAETAGLKIEELNSLVAVISEVSTSSGKETANIAKALIGNYQQESAVKELNRLGIAVIDTTGKTRQFLDVMREVAALRSGGILKDPDFNRLTLALGGGGIRRQKDVSAFIESFSRMDQLTKIQQAGAGGETERAMALQLDTVQVSATRLQNTIVGLAQTLGNEGGLLAVFSGSAKGATLLVEALNTVAKAAGKVGPLLIAVGVSAFLLRNKGGIGGLASMLHTNTGMGMGMADFLTGNTQPFKSTIYDRKAGNMIPNRLGMAGNSAFSFPTAAAIALPAIQNFASGNKEAATANLIGGGIGAAAGAAFGAAPIGALVGSAIAEAFVKTTMTYDKSFVALFGGVVQEAAANKPDTPGKQKPLEDLLKDTYKTLGNGSEQVGSFKAWWEDFTTRKVEFTTDPKTGKWTLNDRAPGSYTSTDAAAYARLQREDPAAAKALRTRMAAEGLLPEGYKTAQTKRQINLSTPQKLEELQGMQQTESDKLKKGVIRGDIKQSDYANRLASLSAFSITATGWMAAALDSSGKLNASFKSNEEAYKTFLTIMGSGNQEAIKSINSIVSEMNTLQDILDKWSGTEVTFTIGGQSYTTSDKKVVEGAKITGQQIFGALATDIAKVATRDQLNLPAVYGGNVTPTPVKDVSAIESKYNEIFSRLYSDLTQKEKEAIIDGFPAFKMLVEMGGDAFYKKVEGKDMALWGEAVALAEKQGLTTGPKADVNWQVSNASASQIREAERKAPAFTANLKAMGVTGLKPLEETVMTTSEKQTIVAHGDQKVISYLLQQILDTEKKQLQGIYNLPEGANIMVPFQGYMLGQQGGGVSPATPADTFTGEKAKSNINKPSDYLGGWGFNNPHLMKGSTDTTAMREKEQVDFYSKPSGFNNPHLSRVMTPKTETTPATSPTNGFMDLLKSLFSPFGPLGGTGLHSGLGSAGGFKGGKDNAPVTTTRMDIKLTSTTNLMVDGRVLASIVKPYLAADLLKANESGGTITRSFVI